jgi:hypothetical protein
MGNFFDFIAGYFLILFLIIPLALFLLDFLVGLLFRTGRWVLLAPLRLLFAGPQLGPYERNRKRAVLMAFVLAFSTYLVWGGSSLLDQSPPWVPLALVVAVALSCLFLLAALLGARNGPRDAFGVVASLTVAGASAVLWWQRYYLPPNYGITADYGNRLLPGLYLAVLAAALVRAAICARLFGGASGLIARTMKRRAAGMRPASGFWAEVRESFEAGRAGRRWRE